MTKTDKKTFERIASLETHITDQNGWIKSLEKKIDVIGEEFNEKISGIDKRVWGILITMITLVVSIICSTILIIR